MAEVVIDNSTCQIKNLSISDYRRLKKLLSYKIDSQAAYFSGSYSRDRPLINKKGVFPTGLLYLVRRYFKNKAKYTDSRIIPAQTINFPVLNCPHVPHLDQVDAAMVAVRCGRGVISIPTGVGKTLVAALIIEALKVKTLIVVPTLELKRQIADDFRAWFGPDHIGKLILIENVEALKPNKDLGVDCVIIDEFHHSAAKTYRKLNAKAWKNVYHRFGLTATAFRSNDNEKILLESILSQVIYRLSYQDAVARGYIVPVEAYYIEVPTTETKKEKWKGVYSDLAVNNKELNSAVWKLLDTCLINKLSTLCLVKEIEHGNNISRGIFPFAHGVEDRTRDYIDRFNSQPAMYPVLVGTAGILGEGCDTKPCEYVILPCYGKSPNQFLQMVGRGVRKYPGKESCKVILFKDDSHRWLQQHFKAQCKLLRDYYGVKAVKL